MEGFDNYYTNFQALFSYIADETVSAGSVGVNPNKGTKMTLRFTACIMGVNMGMLELRDYKILQTAVKSDTLTKRSDFMWIGKDEINSLMRRAEIGLEFKDQDVTDEDQPDNPKVYNLLSPEELEFYHQTYSFALLSRIC